jgi:hypothetical protein
MFGHKRKEVRGGHRILHSEELHDLCISSEGRVAGLGDKMNTGCWWANLKERVIGRPRRRRDDNIKINLKEIG